MRRRQKSTQKQCLGGQLCYLPFCQVWHGLDQGADDLPHLHLQPSLTLPHHWWNRQRRGEGWALVPCCASFSWELLDRPCIQISLHTEYLPNWHHCLWLCLGLCQHFGSLGLSLVCHKVRALRRPPSKPSFSSSTLWFESEFWTVFFAKNGSSGTQCKITYLSLSRTCPRMLRMYVRRRVWKRKKSTRKKR